MRRTQRKSLQEMPVLLTPAIRKVPFHSEKMHSCLSGMLISHKQHGKYITIYIMTVL